MNGGHALKVIKMLVCLLKSRCQDFPMEELNSPFEFAMMERALKLRQLKMLAGR